MYHYINLFIYFPHCRPKDCDQLFLFGKIKNNNTMKLCHITVSRILLTSHNKVYVPTGCVVQTIDAAQIFDSVFYLSNILYLNFGSYSMF